MCTREFLPLVKYAENVVSNWNMEIKLLIFYSLIYIISFSAMNVDGTATKCCAIFDNAINIKNAYTVFAQKAHSAGAS